MNLSESIVFCFAEERQLAIDKMSFGYLLFSFFEVIYIYIYIKYFFIFRCWHFLQNGKFGFPRCCFSRRAASEGLIKV